MSLIKKRGKVFGAKMRRSSSAQATDPGKGLPLQSPKRKIQTRQRSNSDSSALKHTDSTLDLSFRQSLNKRHFPDNVWNKVLAELTPADLAAISRVSKRLRTLSLPFWRKFPSPNRAEADKHMEKIYSIFATHKASIFRKKVSASSISGWGEHPFWKVKTSRFRGLICGAFDKRGGYKRGQMAELRLVHGKVLYYAIIMDRYGTKLYVAQHLTKADCVEILEKFIITTKGDFVVAYKDLSGPTYKEQMHDLLFPEQEKRNADFGTTLSQDSDASVEYGYLNRQRGNSEREVYVI